MIALSGEESYQTVDIKRNLEENMSNVIVIRVNMPVDGKSIWFHRIIWLIVGIAN